MSQKITLQSGLNNAYVHSNCSPDKDLNVRLRRTVSLSKGKVEVPYNK